MQPAHNSLVKKFNKYNDKKELTRKVSVIWIVLYPRLQITKLSSGPDNGCFWN
jgi:hypothetical protein